LLDEIASATLATESADARDATVPEAGAHGSDAMLVAVASAMEGR